MSSNDWKEVKLGEIIDFNPFEKIERGSICKKVSMSELLPFTKEIQDYQIASYNNGSKFRNGDVLFARITPCLENGKTAKVSILEDDEIGFGSTEFFVLRKKKGLSDENYVYYLAISKDFRDLAIKSMTGTSGRQRAQKELLKNASMRIPPLPEQKAIAKILSSLDEKIEINNKINKNLEKMAQSIFKRWFVDFEFPEEDGKPYKSSGGEMVQSELGLIPKGWEVKTLDEIALVTMGQSPKGETYNHKRIGEVFYQGKTDFRSRFPERRLYTTEPKKMAKRGDVLLSVRAPVGAVNVANENCCIGRGLCSISNRLNLRTYSLYLMLYLKDGLSLYNSEGTVFGSINQKEIKNVKLVVSKGNLIEIKFNSAMNSIDQKITFNESESRDLSQIRDALLPKLMSGEIRVPLDGKEESGEDTD